MMQNRVLIVCLDSTGRAQSHFHVWLVKLENIQAHLLQCLLPHANSAFWDQQQYLLVQIILIFAYAMQVGINPSLAFVSNALQEIIRVWLGHRCVYNVEQASISCILDPLHALSVQRIQYPLL